MTRGRFWIALSPVLLLAACGGAPESDAAPDDDDHIARPDEASVSAALQSFFDANPQCTPFFRLPKDVMVADIWRHGQLKPFVDAGILVKSGEIVTKPGSAYPNDHVIRYSAGPRAATDVRPATGTWAGYGQMICYGRRDVESVSFQEPDAFNRTLSVKYRYRLKDVPAWADTPAFRQVYPLFVQRLHEEAEGDEELKLNGGDWRLEKQQDNLGYDFLQQGH